MRTSYCFFLLLFHLIVIAVFPQQSSVNASNRWKGFEKVNLTIGKYSAYYVKPQNPLPGNPWIWRASFPDWHTEMDSLLLTKGMAVAFIHIDDQYGSPAAMQVWDQFYKYMVDTLHFDQKVSLEGISRGGLYVYAWAKRNPGMVNVIYTEAPVCDVKSWPGGKGKSPGDEKCWQQLLNVYGITEKEAIAFNDNPIDHLEGLASFKVPVIHVTGIDDKLVPSEENTDILVHRYTRLGGIAIVDPVSKGPQELQGHHFPIEHTEWWSDFILKNSWPVKNRLKSQSYISPGSGLKNSFTAITEKKSARIAFLGGSITYNPGWRDKVSSWLKEYFPGTDFQVIAAGIPSLGSLPHAFRLQRDLLDSGKIDLLFLEAAVNDKANETDSLTQLRSLEGIIRHAKKCNPLMDIVLLSFADPSKINSYNHGSEPVEVSNHEKIAQWYQLVSINLAKEVHDRIMNNEFTWEDDFKDLHPSSFGQEIYFASIKEMLISSFGQAAIQKEIPSVKTLPEPIQKANFANGRYESVANAIYDKDWLLDKDWTPGDKLATREGFVHCPVLLTDKPGATLTFRFKGNALGIAIVSGADAGKITYSIDGGPYKKLDLYTRWSADLHLPWYLLLGAGLKDKEHQLKIKIIPERNVQSKGNACRIVHFLINAPSG
jgi:sialidase-1